MKPKSSQKVWEAHAVHTTQEGTTWDTSGSPAVLKASVWHINKLGFYTKPMQQMCCEQNNKNSLECTIIWHVDDLKHFM